MVDASCTEGQLAGAVGCDPRAVRFWRQGKNLPRAEQLRPIADLLDVTTDWLLGRGRDDVPERPGRRRAETNLVRELTAHLRAAAARHVSHEYPAVEPHHLTVDGRALLAEFSALVADRALRNVRRAARNRAALADFHRVSGALAALTGIAATCLSDSDNRQLARGERDLHPALNHLLQAAIVPEDFEPGIGVRDGSGLGVGEGAAPEALQELQARQERGATWTASPPPRPSPISYFEEAVRLGDEESRRELAAVTEALEHATREEDVARLRVRIALLSGAFRLRPESPDDDERSLGSPSEAERDASG